MIEQLRDACRKVLAEGRVDVVIGYGEETPGGAVYPVFVRNANDVSKLVWNERCVSNLTTYLTRREIKSMGRPAVVVKGCDARTLVVLEQESQIDRSQMYAVGVACAGLGEKKCEACDAHMPKRVDEVVGEVAETEPTASRYDELDALMAKTPAERWAYWQEEFSRCIKCYACRAVCPLCYCNRCVADKNRPTCIDTSPTPVGNLAWQILRAFHQAGRCVGCGECTRVCPAGINLDLLNKSLAKSAEENFHYRAGTDPETPPVIGSFNTGDKEDFIG
jgi:ferredoxin